MDETSGTEPFEKDNEEGVMSRLERLMRKVPGFGGYLDKRERRESDRELREALSKDLDNARVQLGGISEALSADIVLAIDHAEPLGRVDNRLMGLIGKIKDAPSGYSSFFDANQINEDDLDRLYVFDSAMLAYAEEVREQIEALQKAVDDNTHIAATIKEIDSVLKDANSQFASRNDIIKGLA